MSEYIEKAREEAQKAAIKKEMERLKQNRKLEEFQAKNGGKTPPYSGLTAKDISRRETLSWTC